VKAVGSAVKVVRTVVDGKRKHLTAEQKLAAGDAVAVAPDEGPKENWVRDVIRLVTIAEHDVGQFSVPVGNHQGRHAAAARDDACAHTRRQCQLDDFAEVLIRANSSHAHARTAAAEERRLSTMR